MANTVRSILNPAIRGVFRRCQVLTRYTTKVESHCRYFATRVNVDDDVTDRPTKYTTSKANAMSAQAAREVTTKDDSPWMQTISLVISLAAFLIYFGILREENDIDALIDRDISDKVPGLKEAHEKLKTRAGREAGRRSMNLQ